MISRGIVKVNGFSLAEMAARQEKTTRPCVDGWSIAGSDCIYCFWNCQTSSLVMMVGGAASRSAPRTRQYMVVPDGTAFHQLDGGVHDSIAFIGEVYIDPPGESARSTTYRLFAPPSVIHVNVGRETSTDRCAGDARFKDVSGGGTTVI